MAIETHGMNSLLKYRIENLLDWVTVSPKLLPIAEDFGFIDEVKVVWPQQMDLNEVIKQIPATYYYLQPLDDGLKGNIRKTVEEVLKDPRWSLSLQTQKIVGVR